MTQLRWLRQFGLSAAALGVASWVAGNAGWAANATTSVSAVKLQEVIVTAQRRKQNLQDVGMSITAFDSRELTRLGLTSVTDIARMVPSMQFNEFSPSIIAINMRGVQQNDFSDHEESPIAVYADGVYVASMGAVAGLNYDLARVEVDRGPQGTLFGRNATGGLIQFISAAPTDTPEGYLKVTAGRFNEFNTEGAISGPLTDGIDARLSFASDYHSGIIQNRIGPNSETQRQFAGRLQLLFKLSGGGNFLLKLYGLRNPHVIPTSYSWAAAAPNAQGNGVFVGPNQNPWGTCNGCDLSGYRNPSSDVFNQAYGRPGAGIFDRSYYGATGTLTLPLGGSLTLTSITDYQHLDKRYGEDSDASPNDIFNYDTNQHFYQFSQELHLAGKSGSLRWITGLFILAMDTHDQGVVSLASYLGGTSGTLYSLRTRSYSLFGQAEWDITRHWVATLGGRYTYDDRVDNYTLYAPTPQNVLYTFNQTLNPSIAKQTANLPTAKAELDYRIDPSNMVYASVNLGAKGGGFIQNPVPPAPSNPEDMIFHPEKLIDYETGFKSTFFHGRARLDADAFYYDYRGMQAFALQGFVEVLRNFKARDAGWEGELSVLPLTGLELQLGVSNLYTRIYNVTLPAGQVVDTSMPEAPKWSVNAMARYQWAALGATWSVEADTKSDSAMHFDTFNSPVGLEPARTVTNARLGYTSGNGKFDVSVFCNNLTDRRYRVYSLDLSALGFDQQTYAPPRWYGATVTYHWD